MKTEHIKITNRTAQKLPNILAATFAIFLGLGQLAQAQESELLWDGPNQDDESVEGGNGDWSPPSELGNDNWVSDNENTQWDQGSVAVFGVTPGTVMVTTTPLEAILCGGMTFQIGGYQIEATTGSSLELDGSITIRTDPGVTATISVPLTDPSEASGGFTKAGAGTLTLSGTNTYSGETFVEEGILNIQNGSALGVTTNGTDIESDATLQLQGGISVGAEQLTIRGVGAIGQNGALVNVSGTNNYGGLLGLGDDSTISSDSGTLNLTNTGTIIGGRLPFGLTLTGAGDGSISSIIATGIGTLTKSGAGTWTLNGVNTYTGPTTVNAGALLVDGSLMDASAVTVNSGGTLGGIGTAAGAVTIADGGILAPGDSPGTLTVGSLSLSNTSLLNYELGPPGVIGKEVNDLTVVSGNLTLDGILNTTSLAGFGPGAYRLFDYGGALTDNTLDIGTVPTVFMASNFTIVTGLPNEIDLLVLAGPNPPAVQFWDGPDTQGGNGIDGGTGNWDNFTTNWTDAAGATNSSWQNGEAVFGGMTGTVTVTQPIFFTGMAFMKNYLIDATTKNSLNLIGSPTISTDLGVIATISAPIEGAGGIIKEGPGTLVLSGANIYFGSTTINAGILSISSDANLGTPPGQEPVANQLTFDGGTLQATASFALKANRGITLLTGGGTIAVTEDNLLSYGGVISGAGSLTKTDIGTLELSGVNTYTGATAINGGTLRAGLANTLPSQSAVSVDAGATCDLNSFDQSIGSLAGDGSITLGTATLTTGNDNTSTDFAGIISGSGGLTKVGTGTQTLSGANTHFGATILNSGTLSISSDANLGTAPGTPVSDQLTFNGGTLQGTAGFALNANRGITLLAGGGTIGVTDANALSYGGVITGSGSLTKIDIGTLDLLGLNTYSGTTTVNDGSLIVDGSVASKQTLVNPGGLLGGHGVVGVGGSSLMNSGIVSPGNSTGTLTVGAADTANSNYTQTTGGTLRIEVAGLGATEHDMLVVNGTATLAGTLQLIRLNNFQFQPGDQITFLTATGGVSGTFNPVENDFSISGTIVESQIVYLSNSVVLEETQGSFATVCPNPNDIAVGTALDSAVGDSRASELIQFLDTVPLSELCDVLDLLSPAPLASIFNTGVSVANIQTVNLERRMDDIRAGSKGFSASGFTINGNTPNYIGGLAGPTGPEGKSGPSVMQPTPDNRWGVFVTGLGEFTDVGNTNNASGYDLTTGGLTLGVDYRVSPNFAIGLTGGYAHTNAGLANNGSLDVNGGKIGLYATVFGGGFYLDTAVTGGFDGYDTSRTALLGSARGSTSGGDLTALVAGGYDWKSGGLSIGPIASFQYTYVGFDSFTESGSLAPLSFNSQNADSIRTALGFKTSYEWKIGGVLLKPELRASWQHEFGDTDYAIAAQLASGAGNSFTVNGPAIGRDSLLVGAGVAVLLNDRISTYAYYDGELARTNYISNNVSAGVRVNF